MANEAHKEPTMEEILASIRKIIADDTPAAAPSAGARPAPAEDIAFDNDSDLGMFEGEAEAEDDAPEERISGPEFSFEEMLGTAARQAPEPEEAFEEPAAPAPAPEPTARLRPTTPQPVETAMPASPRYANDPLTDDNTADAAAGALGKLISKMDLGGSDNTIEGLVREMLKPMVKEWLDANLARIVEEKVEAEVQRIARMAR